ncbi:MAG: hypothetical protein E6G47_12710 [Actinobacteria bacterium]|nr:MAG: hypothetical protein E6G47_12710 [Actinomycetota bacterium]
MYLLDGRVDAAAKSTERALTLAGKRGQQAEVAVAYRLLADIALYRDRADLQSAKSHYEAAVELGGRLGIRPLVARCHLGLGRLYGRAGPATLAIETLRMAVAMTSDMGMSYWKDLAEDEANKLITGT